MNKSDLHSLLRQRDQSVKTFIADHLDTDLKKLALQSWPNEPWAQTPETRTCILDQIKSRQKALKKLPHMAQNFDLIMPRADLVEQASSFATATYKASLFHGETCIDLTAGCGIDTFALAQNFTTTIAVERDTYTCKTLSHNKTYTAPNKNVQTHNIDAETFLKNAPRADLIYIDPQRRTDQKRGLFKFSECSPNILELLPIMAHSAQTIMIKTSPMLSIERAVKDLPHLTDIHVVEWQNQCKEILLILHPNTAQAAPNIHSVRLHDNGNIHDTISYTYSAEKTDFQNYSAPLAYLHEPAPAYQKARSVHALSKKFDAPQLAPHTYLLTSDHTIENFPGRSFKIMGELPAHKKSIPFTKANLTIRNFPASVDQLRKKLKLKDGGDEYLFACTLKDERKIILHARKDNIKK